MNPFEGKMIVITAPSGAGKTTIVKHLLKTFDFLDFSVSATTRPQRPDETDGVDYYFVSKERFLKMIEEHAFAEYEVVYADQYYGTLHSEIMRIWSEHKHIIFDIDVVGALTLKKNFEDKCFAIFVKPPSKEVMTDRLRSRKTEDHAGLAQRIAKADYEMKFERLFDFSLVNDLLEVTLKEAELLVERFIFPGDEEE